jgi:hypothetical protein
MTGLLSAMRNNNGQDLSVSTVIGPVTASLVEQDEPLRAKQGIYLSETDVPRRPTHLLQCLLATRQLFLLPAVGPRFT